MKQHATKRDSAACESSGRSCGGTGGDGVSFSYGELPDDYIDEMGAGEAGNDGDGALRPEFAKPKKGKAAGDVQ